MSNTVYLIFFKNEIVSLTQKWQQKKYVESPHNTAPNWPRHIFFCVFMCTHELRMLEIDNNWGVIFGFTHGFNNQFFECEQGLQKDKHMKMFLFNWTHPKLYAKHS